MQRLPASPCTLASPGHCSDCFFHPCPPGQPAFLFSIFLFLCVQLGLFRNLKTTLATCPVFFALFWGQVKEVWEPFPRGFSP